MSQTALSFKVLPIVLNDVRYLRQESVGVRILVNDYVRGKRIATGCDCPEVHVKIILNDAAKNGTNEVMGPRSKIIPREWINTPAVVKRYK